ncbi:hypothetical protein B6N25_04025 [Sphingobacteriales bacterium TSM_CSS]|nr:hypothetical protein B6N25_04025 [Sphingobacteriales bacterium TSM_CSS]
MTKAIFWMLLMLTGLFCRLNAQKLEPVKWSFSSDKISETEYVLFFDAQIESGWHVNASVQQTADDAALIAPQIVFNPTEAVTHSNFTNEIGEMEVVPQSIGNKTVNVYANRVTYNAIVIKKSRTQVAEISGYVSFIACDANRCLSPQKVPFEFNLN